MIQENMSTCLETVFHKISPSSQQTVESGEIKTSIQTVEKADEALAAFKKFGGQGWLCTAESRDIHVFHTGYQGLEGQWPRWGESFDSDKDSSLHLRYIGGVWTLTTYCRREDSSGIIMETELLGKHGGKDIVLVYEIYYRLDEKQKIAPCQYRPFNSRFIGFRKEISNG